MSNNKIKKIKKLWEQENITNPIIIKDNEILSFQIENNLLIPDDFAEYFKQLNGTNDQYDKNFFRFYSFSELRTLDLAGSLIFVFSDYLFCMFSYAIKLYPKEPLNNEILILCGNEYKIIANSFSEFLDLYLDNAIELQFNE